MPYLLPSGAHKGREEKSGYQLLVVVPHGLAPDGSWHDTSNTAAIKLGPHVGQGVELWPCAWVGLMLGTTPTVGWYHGQRCAWAKC